MEDGDPLSSLFLREHYSWGQLRRASRPLCPLPRGQRWVSPCILPPRPTSSVSGRGARAASGEAGQQMDKDSTCPTGRKQPQELGSEPSTGSPARCWKLGARCQGRLVPPTLSKGWTGESANIRSLSWSTFHLGQFDPSSSLSLSLPQLGWRQEIWVPILTLTLIHRPVLLSEFSCSI